MCLVNAFLLVFIIDLKKKKTKTEKWKHFKDLEQERIFTSTYSPLREKAMAPHSSTVARIIPWMEEPGELQSMGLLRVGHD